MRTAACLADETRDTHHLRLPSLLVPHDRFRRCSPAEHIQAEVAQSEQELQKLEAQRWVVCEQASAAAAA